MKKLFMSMLLVLFVSSFSFAQINKNWDGTKPEVYKGSKNFVFIYSPFVSSAFGSAPAGSFTSPVFINGGEGGNFDSTNVTVSNMFGIGFQYYVTNEIALAVGLSFGSASYEPVWAGSTVKSTSTAFGLSLDGNYHFKALYGVSPYLGLNVNFGTNSRNTDVTSGGTTSNFKSSGSAIGFGANFGFDWYFIPGLSLGGKYTLGMNMNASPDATSTSGGTTVTRTGPKTSSFGTGSASIMLNVHI